MEACWWRIWLRWTLQALNHSSQQPWPMPKMANIMWQSWVSVKDEDWMFPPLLRLKKHVEYIWWLLLCHLRSDNLNSSKVGQPGWVEEGNIPLCCWPKLSPQEKLSCKNPWLLFLHESSSTWPGNILMCLRHHCIMLFQRDTNNRRKIRLKKSPKRIWSETPKRVKMGQGHSNLIKSPTLFLKLLYSSHWHTRHCLWLTSLLLWKKRV